MEKAKADVMGFLNKHGKHDTSVHETVNPAVTNETVNHHKHDNIITAKDKEVHQDHYHTTVQPVHDEKTLPEQHHYNTVPVEHRKFEHGNDEEVERRLRTEREKFRDTTTKGETRHTSHNVDPIVSEHVHHHVHENIQPVVNRQTIEPHVTHTTIPIHEVHHSAAQHHSSTALPAMSMADFKKSGGSLGGREQRSDFFEGEPRSMHGHNPLSGNASNTGVTGTHGTSGGHGAGVGTAAGVAGGLAAGKAAHGHRSGRDRTTGRRGSSSSSSSSDDEHHKTKKTGLAGGLTGSHAHHNAGAAGSTGLGSPNHNATGAAGSTALGSHNHNATGAAGSTGLGSHTATNVTSNTHPRTGTDGVLNHSNGGLAGSGVGHADHSASAKKPGLLDRLNPLKDADGDGKKGFMD